MFFFLQAVSHKRRHHHGDSRSNQLLSSIRSKRQHSPYGKDPYYSSYGYGAPDSGRQDTYPDTYVLDEFGQTEEEAGAWSEWSSPSECSRPCGGGVSAQSRQCLDRRFVVHLNLHTYIYMMEKWDNAMIICFSFNFHSFSHFLQQSRWN